MNISLRVGWFFLLVGTLSGAALAQPPAAGAAGKPVDGSLTIGKQIYKLTSVAAYETKWFDMTVTNVVASNKAIPIDKLKAALAKDGTDDSFTLWKPNIRVTFNAEGKPISINAWADNRSISISGGDLSGELAVKDSNAKGTFKMPLDAEAGRGCEFTFATPLIANPKAKESGEKKDVAESPAGGGDDDDKPSHGSKSHEKPTPSLNIYKLPLPKDAANLEYKTLVEQFAFTSATDYTKLAKSFGDQLTAAGWKKDPGGELVGKSSAILKRKQGDAEMTIFIKPAEKGSTVLIMAEGMSWDKPDDGGAPALQQKP